MCAIMIIKYSRAQYSATTMITKQSSYKKWSRLNVRRFPTCCVYTNGDVSKLLQYIAVCCNSRVQRKRNQNRQILSRDHIIARRGSTNKTVLLSCIGSGDVITLKTQFDKTVLLSWVESRRATWSLLKLRPTVGRIFVQSVRVVKFWTFQNLLKLVGVSRATWSLSRLAKTSVASSDL